MPKKTKYDVFEKLFFGVVVGFLGGMIIGIYYNSFWAGLVAGFLSGILTVIPFR